MLYREAKILFEPAEFGRLVEVALRELAKTALQIEQAIADRDPEALRFAAHSAKNVLMSAELNAEAAAVLDLKPSAGEPFQEARAHALLAAVRSAPSQIRRRWLGES